MRSPRAYIHHYDDHGRRTKKPERVRAHMATNNTPPILEIVIPDKLKTKFRSIYITIDELKKALGS